MSRIIKEPFSPRRRHLMSDYRHALSGVSFFSSRLKGSLVGFRNITEASLDDLCMIVLLVSLLVTTLLLPWSVM
jgi:hypothetical protein